MAAGNWTLYQAAKLALTQAQMNLASGAANIAMVLVGTGYTPSVNSDATYANVSANEVTGTGYTAGGQIVTSETDAAASGTVTVSAAAASWPTSTITAQYAVLVYRASAATAAASDKLIAYANLNSGGSAISSTNGTFSVGGGAIFTLT